MLLPYSFFNGHKRCQIESCEERKFLLMCQAAALQNFFGCAPSARAQWCCPWSKRLLRHSCCLSQVKEKARLAEQPLRCFAGSRCSAPQQAEPVPQQPLSPGLPCCLLPAQSSSPIPNGLAVLVKDKIAGCEHSSAWFKEK